MSARPFLLVVCEGNLCRSPLAAALLAVRLPQADVRSAGLAPP
ncbi:low molecular weight phosphotyrosine protein phosphatase, partial [Burkholderia territorii]